MQDVNNGGGCLDGGMWELSVLSAQFFSKSKIAQKLSINLKAYNLKNPSGKNNHCSLFSG